VGEWTRAAAGLDLSTLKGSEKQLTHGPGGRLVTNIGAWTPDGEWIAYDTRSDRAGEDFNGLTIEMVNVQTGEVKVLYTAHNGAHCGVVTVNPREPKVVFILGPENPSADWQYNFYHRRGVIVEMGKPGRAVNLDACDITPPFTPGALRGGSHVHVWDPAGQWLSFTYEDHVLAKFKEAGPDHDMNLRNVGVSVPGRPVHVSHDHPRNHDGDYFSVVVTRTVANPKPGSDEIKKAFEEGWIGTNGYLRADGTRQKHAMACQGLVVTEKHETISEVFLVDLPEDLTVPGDGPLAGTETRIPYPPKGVVQRRLTHTENRKFPGLQGPRHWLRSSPEGNQIAFLMKDDRGVVQLWTISPNGGLPREITRNLWPIASAFTWSPDARMIAHVMDNSVCVTDAGSGETVRLTERTDDARAPRPETCVFSPDGTKIAFIRRLPEGDQAYNQICVVGLTH
jgi:hypothetical protein